MVFLQFAIFEKNGPLGADFGRAPGLWGPIFIVFDFDEKWKSYSYYTHKYDKFKPMMTKIGQILNDLPHGPRL